MDLEQKIMEQLKTAMKEKNQVALASLRAVKSAILMEKTAGSDSTLSEADEIKILQRQIKQRKEAAEQFIASGAMEMAEEEMAQAAVIEQFLPVQLTEDEVIGIVKKIIIEVSAKGISEMGKVIGLASQKIGGQSDGKTISQIVKKLLS